MAETRFISDFSRAPKLFMGARLKHFKGAVYEVISYMHDDDCIQVIFNDVDDPDAVPMFAPILEFEKEINLGGVWTPRFKNV